ncbi:BQ2448_7750 [Microbotryum intermedium]|uniref:BQ2448_7750 protein n=1 Tax=Microbotryum intermedium TaxID=269621 RepID=A0A238FR84_9BASI|nr:BQ2448_7750 [Microbotryum intermedium]
MAPKRPNDASSDTVTPRRDYKRQRLQQQRTIDVQRARTTSSTSDATRPPRSAPPPPPPRPGGSAARGNHELPPTIDVDKFAQARSFEIEAMRRAIKSAKEANTQRAFQSLPRHLRRRAASHNIRRLPTRLRKRALAEGDNCPPPPKKTPKDAAKPKKVTRKMLGPRRRLRGRSKAAALLKRQRGKLWLETHVWHAKRMHMTTRWGYRLVRLYTRSATRPTEKAFRPSYRASVHGALVHDASYMQYIELTGPQVQLEALSRLLCPLTPAGPASKRFTTGIRECRANVYHAQPPQKDSSAATSPPPLLIGPACFIWDVAPSGPTGGASSSTSNSTIPSPPHRQLLVRLHPTLNKAVLDVIATHLGQGQDTLSSIEARPLEQELLTFELTGQRSTEIIKACLKPTIANAQDKLDAWKVLDDKAGAAGVPSSMVLGLSVYDPRLSYPPKLAKAPHSKPSNMNKPLLQPGTGLARLDAFWSPKARGALRKPHYTKHDLDQRRSELLVPGTSLTAQAQDDRIPLLLVQRSLCAAPNSPEAMYGWTLVVPAGWGMAFWTSLVHAQARVGGLQQVQQQSFEAGVATWPHDFVGTRAFDEYEIAREVEDKGHWDRRPPAKRPSWDKLGTESPWRAELGHVIEKRWKGQQIEAGSTGRRSKTVWLVESAIARGVENVLLERAAAATRSSEVKSNAKSKGKPQASPTAMPSSASTLVDEYVKRLVEEYDSLNPNAATTVGTVAVLETALVQCRVTPLGRGAPEELGLVYSLDRERRDRIAPGLDRKRASDGRDEDEDDELLCEIPTKEDVMGRITSGGFSLARGRGHAIAVVPLFLYLDMVARDAT